MKFDIRKNISLHGEQYFSFTEVLVELLISIKTLSRLRWKKHLLRCAIKSERKTLAKLSDRELDDIGINRVEAALESQRQFNDLPDNRPD